MKNETLIGMFLLLVHLVAMFGFVLPAMFSASGDTPVLVGSIVIVGHLLFAALFINYKLKGKDK